MLKKLKKIAKDLLSIPLVRKFYVGSSRIILKIASLNRFTATVYSIFGIVTFNREQYAVLKGRSRYYSNISKDRRTSVELRRNIHRLEKGIIMQPRRDYFARDYIGETIDFYERAIRQYRDSRDSIELAELEWANSVLDRYFSTCKKGNEKIDEARSRYESMERVSNQLAKSPYKVKERRKHSVTFDEMKALAQHRRSVRWFKDKKVPRKDIDKALEVAALAPTACNRIPYEYKIFNDPAVAREVAGIPFGAGGYSDQVPAIAVLVGKLDNYFSPRDRHAIYVDGSLSAMSFIYALDTLGVSSCIINWPDFEPLEIKMQKRLGLDVDERVVMLIAFGYADPNGEIPYSQKKELSTFVSYNQLGN